MYRRFRSSAEKFENMNIENIETLINDDMKEMENELESENDDENETKIKNVANEEKKD